METGAARKKRDSDNREANVRQKQLREKKKSG